MTVQRDANGVITNAGDLTVDDVVGNRVLCPICNSKVFEQWPFGWDSHSATQCSAAVGATETARKATFKEKYGHLFRE